MFTWQHLMRKGNAYFDANHWVKAEYCYYQALSLLEVVWKKEPENTEIMQAWVCAQHNLASTFEKQALLENAAENLFIAHHVIIQRMNDKNYSELAQSLALRMSAITYRSILEFKKKYAEYVDCQNWFATTNIEKPFLPLH